MKLIYCDYIADIIQTALNMESKLGIDAGDPQRDIQDGYMVSLKKTVHAIDMNGTRYKITIEEDKANEKEEEADVFCGMCDNENVIYNDTEVSNYGKRCNDCGHEFD